MQMSPIAREPLHNGATRDIGSEKEKHAAWEAIGTKIGTATREKSANERQKRTTGQGGVRRGDERGKK